MNALPFEVIQEISYNILKDGVTVVKTCSSKEEAIKWMSTREGTYLILEIYKTHKP